jgi:hypothetical protein
MGKYNIRDEVYFMECDVARKGKITGIITYEGHIKTMSFDDKVPEGQIVINYVIDCYTTRREEALYNSVLELQSSVFKNLK